jgi:hypothetical protein
MVLNTLPAVTVEAGALGAIVENPDTRKRIYAWNTIVGLALTALFAGLGAGAVTAIAAVAAGWHIGLVIGAAVLAGISGAYAALQPQVSALARANTPSPTVGEQVE